VLRGEELECRITFIIKLKYRDVSTMFYRSKPIVIIEGERSKLKQEVRSQMQKHSDGIIKDKRKA
jgi:hypothetical protein